DLDNDGTKEILALGADKAQKMSYLYVWKPDGTRWAGNFPIAIPNKNSNHDIYGYNRVLPVDLDGNGTKELLVAAGESIYSMSILCYNSDGAPRAAWKKLYLDGVAFRQMTTADLDHDGKCQVVLLHDNLNGLILSVV